jgi:hypothetical protein
MFLLVGCGPVMKPVERVISPSGAFLVAAIPNESKSDPTKWRCIRLILMDRSGATLSAVQTGVSDGQKWAVGWMETGDVIVLQSSDIGTQAFNVLSNDLKQITVTPDINGRAAELKKAKYGN